jgi:hypothetical protein
MMKRLLPFLSIALGLGFSVNAQNYRDVARYSNQQPFGTARFIAMGGAFSALGGDLSAIHLNPAGVAVFNKSEAGLSLNFVNIDTESSYWDNPSQNTESAFNLSNFGFVTNDEPLKKESRWNRWALGITYNRLNDFNGRTLVDGINPNTSYSTVFLQGAQGFSIENLGAFDTYLAWDSYLIDTLGTVDNYVNTVAVPGQRERVIGESSGGMNEFGISVGGMLDKKFYVGGSVNLASANYNSRNLYTESDFIDSNAVPLDYWSFENILKSTGTGVNLKIGAIWMATKYFRVSAAYHSPTWWEFTEEYTAEMKTGFNNGANFISTSPLGYYEYQMTTAGKLLLGTAFVLGNHGLISVDYEFVYNQNGRLKADNFSFSEANQEIQNLFERSNNLRLGAEWRIGIISLRGGYAVVQGPYGDVQNGLTNILSGGFAFRGKDWLLEMAYQTAVTNSEDYLYQPIVPEMMEKAQYTTTRNSVVVTLGMKF